MSNVTKVKENVSRIVRNREYQEAKRTDGCLLSTCFFRYVFQLKHARAPTLSECPETCCYHPEHKCSSNSPGRTRRKTRVGQYSALEYKFQATQNNRQEKAIYTDPSPF